MKHSSIRKANPQRRRKGNTMTKQQIKDYQKVQSIDILGLWLQWDERYKEMTLEELPIRCAISDMEMIISDGVESGHTKEEVKAAKWFLKKYAK